MDKKGWPWKKKSSDKINAPQSESFDSGASPRNPHDHNAVSVLVDCNRDPDEPKAGNKEYEQKIKELKEKLSTALADAANKDDLAKQHAKVAEEAVSGWEKAQEEAATLKEQLDSTTQQKMAAEDRVSHLDGALKECMRQLRHAREQQEENIHSAIAKKTMDWDNERAALEGQVADLEQRLLERDAESRAMTKLLQERAKTISEMAESCSKAESEINTLRIRLEVADKEKLAFKYELHVVQKELEIRNEEKGLSKRAADAAHKQHLEDIRKISKLEAENQRLRGLVRKKLPGPAALAQMRFEIESLTKDNKKKPNKPFASTKIPPIEGVQCVVAQEDYHLDRDGNPCPEQFSALEEEIRLLRESLVGKENELHSARLMCTRTASKLASVEKQLQVLSQNQEITKMPLGSNADMLLGSMRSSPNAIPSEDDGNLIGDVDRVESWATALIAELDQFKKDKPVLSSSRLRGLSATDFDDFVEMERLASLSRENVDPIPEMNNTQGHKDGPRVKDSASVASGYTASTNEQTLRTELWEACYRNEDTTAKLAAAEEEMTAWKSKSSTDQARLLSLKEKLDMLFEAQDTSGDVEKVLSEIRKDMGMPRNPIPSLRNRNMRLSGKCSFPDDASDFKIYEGSPDPFLSAVCEVLQLVEELAVASTIECNQHSESLDAESSASARNSHSENSGSFEEIISVGQPKSICGLSDKFHKLAAVKEEFLQKKTGLVQLMQELAAVLSYLLKARKLHINKSSCCSRSIHGIDFTEAGSPISDTSKSDGSEAAAKIVPADESSFNGDQKDRFFQLEVLKLEEQLRKLLSEKNSLEQELRTGLSEKVSLEHELRKVLSEKIALETHMKVEFSRFSAVQEELAKLRLDKVEKDGALAIAKDKLESLNKQLQEREQTVRNLQAQLSSSESRKKNQEEELHNMAVLKDQSDCQLKVTRSELSKVQERVEHLLKEIVSLKKSNSDLEAKCKELRAQLEKKSDLSCPKCTMSDGEADQAKKEQEIAAAAEKLAECQRSILVLGQQLKALASPRQSTQQSVLPHEKFSSERYTPVRSHGEPCPDSPCEVSSSMRFLNHEEHSGGRNRKSSWDPRDCIASDMLDSELISLSIQGMKGGRKTFEMFGNSKVPVHEDYIEAVAQMPSSPEAEGGSPKRLAAKLLRRKKRNSHASGGSDGAGASPVSAEKQQQGMGFARFFSRTKNSN